jgi:hypothetical protein
MAVTRSELVSSLMVAACVACGRGPNPVARADAGTVSSAAPVDRLRPGELAPGNQEAFGILLPRGVKVDQRFEKVVYASGELDNSAVANFLRERITAGRIELGTNRTLFSGVHLGDANREYWVEVLGGPGRCRVVVRDVTPEPVPAGLSEEELWKRAGFSPDGRPLDPNNLK